MVGNGRWWDKARQTWRDGHDRKRPAPAELEPARTTKAEREMIVVVVSAANQCQYCVVAHGAILRIRAKSPVIADQIATNYRKADITPKQVAMLDFAMKVSRESERLDEADFAAMRAAGFTEEDIWDAGAVAALFALSNRMANLTGMRPNDEFDALGRSPK